MNAVLQIAAGIAGFVLLCAGADFLVRGGVQIARRLHVTPLVIGLTLVAFATSAPELVVSCDAALRGAGDIALGNVIGSNICNIALILGVSSVITPLRVSRKLLGFDVPLMAGASILFVLFYIISNGINRLEGALFFAGIAAYVVISIRTAKSRGETVPDTEVDAGGGKPDSLFFSIFLAAAGLGMLAGGAKLLVGAAVWLAQSLGVSEAVIGLTVVAVGTSLPELAASAAAALKGEGGMAIGNVIGSNIFNILAILGVSALLRPLEAVNIRPMDLAVMLFCTIALCPAMRTGYVISRREGAFFLTVYAGYMVWLVLSN